MSDQLAQIAGPPRDRWGRYLLPIVDDIETRVAYTRATTVAKAPEDQGGLMRWAQRTVVAGLGKRPDLVALAASTDPADKTALGRIAKDAEESGGAAHGRNTGTAIHAAIEAVNRGQEPLPLFAVEVAAYRAALGAAGLTPVPELVERIVCHDDPRIAGTFDVALRDASGQLFVADLKTGSMNYPASMAIQLAIYATADHLVSVDYSTLEPIPKWSHHHGIIIHLPPGGPCTLHRIDLVEGRRGLKVALQVREWRSTAKPAALLTEIVVADGPNNPTGTANADGVVETMEPQPAGRRSPEPDRLAWFGARYDAVRGTVGPEAIRAAWPTGLPTPKLRDQWTPAELDRAIKVLDRLDATTGAPFGAPDPQPAKLRRKPGPGKKVATREDAQAAKIAFTDLPDDRRSLVLAWQSEATTVARSWTPLAKDPTRWSVSVAMAACRIAAHTDDDEVARGWITLVIGDNDTDGHPVGALLGSLTLTEAEQLCELAGADTFAAAIATMNAA